MTRRDDGARLRDMLDHAREAVEMIRGHDRAELGSNRMLNLAVVRLLEIVGEAGARVSVETRERHGDVPWAGIIEDSASDREEDQPAYSSSRAPSRRG